MWKGVALRSCVPWDHCLISTTTNRCYRARDYRPPQLMESPVLLGVPDGPLTDAADLKNPRVSRLGGEPVRDDLASLDAVGALANGARGSGAVAMGY